MRRQDIDAANWAARRETPSLQQSSSGSMSPDPKLPVSSMGPKRSSVSCWTACRGGLDRLAVPARRDGREPLLQLRRRDRMPPRDRRNVHLRVKRFLDQPLLRRLGPPAARNVRTRVETAAVALQQLETSITGHRRRHRNRHRQLHDQINGRKIGDQIVARSVYRPIAARTGAKAVEIALAWLLARPGLQPESSDFDA